MSGSASGSSRRQSGPSWRAGRAAILCLLGAVLTLSGCVTSMPPSLDQANLLRPCPAPAALPPRADYDDVEQALVRLAGLYHECRARHARLGAAVRGP